MSSLLAEHGEAFIHEINGKVVYKSIDASHFVNPLFLSIQPVQPFLETDLNHKFNLYIRGSRRNRSAQDNKKTSQKLEAATKQNP